MSTGTSSLRRTKRRGAALVAACAAALVAALAGPAWAGSVPQPDDPPAGPRSEAAPRIATAPVKAATLEARATRAAGTEASTPTPDAPVTAPTAQARKPQADAAPGRREKLGRSADPDEHRDPRGCADPQLHGSRAAPRRTRLPSALRDRRLRRSRKASRAAGERKEADFPGANDCRGATGREPPRPADRDADALVRHLRRRSERAAGSAALLLLRPRGGGLVVGVAGRRLARIT